MSRLTSTETRSPVATARPMIPKISSRYAVTKAISGQIEDPASPRACGRDMPSGRSLGTSDFFTKTQPTLFAALAYQLVSVVPGRDDHLWATIHEGQTVFKKSMGEQLDRLIIQPLFKLITGSARMVTIIDAWTNTTAPCPNGYYSVDVTFCSLFGKQPDALRMNSQAPLPRTHMPLSLYRGSRLVIHNVQGLVTASAAGCRAAEGSGLGVSAASGITNMRDMIEESGTTHSIQRSG
ncbi:hypothetical protein BD779DRAFT_1477259 [Infundibulicybe gibba]|nr:hypothetical protein BD779DRAFT_1477259 [Infundibulicybe gibba]